MKKIIMTIVLSLIGTLSFCQLSKLDSTNVFLKNLESDSWIGKVADEICVLTIIKINENENEYGWHDLTFSLRRTDEQELILKGGIQRYLDEEFRISADNEGKTLNFFSTKYNDRILSFNGTKKGELHGSWFWGENDMEMGEDFSLSYIVKSISHDENASVPIIKSIGNSSKYFDWGPKPTEPEDGPPDMWTWDHMMCNGPDYEWVSASSTLAPQGKFNYSIKNICDDNPQTAWVEGSPDYGIGEYFELKDWIPMGEGEIGILNGYQYNKSVWETNSRVKKFSVSLDGKEVFILELDDVMGVQRFYLPQKVYDKIAGTYTETTNEQGGYSVSSNNDGGGVLRFTIIEVYKGTKYKDTCITGIFSCGG